MTLSAQLGNKQTDPTNAFVEKKRQSQEAQWAMGLIKSASEKVEILRSFSVKTCRKKTFLTKTGTTRRSTNRWFVN